MNKLIRNINNVFMFTCVAILTNNKFHRLIMSINITTLMVDKNSFFSRYSNFEGLKLRENNSILLSIEQGI